jgi:ubiquinone/menaquinone biosynthesis C-methylase UbiE
LSGASANRGIFDSVAHAYTELALMPAEQRALGILGERLHRMEMLDLGVGAGRTGYTFAPLTRRYVGLDYSPKMLERARRLLDHETAVELVHGQAQDLSAVEGPFDFVLFSFNGIDASSHEDRARILAEVRRVLRPDGYFLFSSHSLWALPLDSERAPSARLQHSRLYRLYAKAAGVRYARRIRNINRKLDLETARARGWTIVPGRGHDFRIDDHYVDPEYQVEQLAQAGFTVEAIFDPDGVEVTLPLRGRDPWLDYLCRPSG